MQVATGLHYPLLGGGVRSPARRARAASEPRLLFSRGRAEEVRQVQRRGRGGSTGQVNYVIRITCAIKMYGNRFHHCTPRLLSKR